jgi:sensory rhodopsin
MAVETWFMIGAIGMALGTIPPVRDLFRRPTHRRYDAVLAGITGFAAVAYAAMALGYTEVTAGETTFFVARYIDWLVTTPLIVLYLAMLTDATRRQTLALLAVDAFVILAGIVAAFSAGSTRWAFFAAGGAGYLVLTFGLLRTLPAAVSADANARVWSLFVTLRNITVVLWTLYPIVWLLGPAGFGVLQYEMYTIVVVYLDFISKVGFVGFAALGADAIDYLTGDRVGAQTGYDPLGSETPTATDDD